ncbi:Hypothetical predicted protein [Olea europaea subsp. europaea]|uniref:Uncharacterized protein n=1 Tax=Olea europaea subsp. europaea TaxID=158383 RepID=A0A8S0SYI8_OLEEU|nr:Hypothetical predicted protein [Olea europaea subsp. europaea]
MKRTEKLSPQFWKARWNVQQLKRINLMDGLDDNGEKYDQKAFGKEPGDHSGASMHDEFQERCIMNSWREDNNVESSSSESACSSSKLTPQLAKNVPSVSHA